MEKELNERQKIGIRYLKIRKKMTRKEYAEINKCTDITAKRDLSKLVQNKILKRVGKTGRHVYYIFKVNGSSNGSVNGSSSTHFNAQHEIVSDDQNKSNDEKEDENEEKSDRQK